MANEISITEIDEFLASPIVTWFVSCLDGGESLDKQADRLAITYEELVDGVLIYDVLLQMDIDGQSNDVRASHDEADKRLDNLEASMRRIRRFYEDRLGEVILCQPDVRLVARQPRAHVRELELLLVLLLGCAVKCPNNAHFVRRITLLDERAQTAIASYISKVLHFPDIVLSKEMLLLEDTSDDDEQRLARHKQKVHKAFEAIRRVSKQRGELLEQLRSSARSRSDAQSCEKQLNEWRSEAMTLSDQLDECKRKLTAMTRENKRLAAEAKSHRDALDEASEKLQRTERLDKEVACCREKLRRATSYRVRNDELERTNRALREGKDELAAQLSACRRTSERRAREMQMEIGRLRQRCDELAVENEAGCERNAQLREENANLERRMKLAASMSVTLDSSLSAEADESFNSYENSSIREQLSQSIRSQLLKLELESRRLETVSETSQPILDLEQEKKRLELVNENLNATIRQLEENLTSASREATRLRVLLETGSGEWESERKSAEKTIDELAMKLHEDSDDELLNESPAKRQLQERKLKLCRDEAIAEEHANLKQDFSLLMCEYRKEKSRSDELAKHQREYQQRLQASNAKILELDARNGKLRDECELLSELTKQLESDKKMLTNGVSQMLMQNRELAAESLKKQRQFHEDERKNCETLNRLNRAKAKLEDKVMAQYRDVGDRRRRDAKKRSGAAVSAVKSTLVKVRRAGSEFFAASSRRSCANESDDLFAASSSRGKTLDDRTSSKTITGFTRVGNEPSNNNSESVDFLENISPENLSFDSTKAAIDES